MANVNVNIPKSAINAAYLPHLDNYARTQIFFGGSSSGKSVFAVGQRVVYRLLKGGHNFLICRQTKNSLRASVITEVKKVIEDWGLSQLFDINKTDGTITCKNGYQAAFVGLDDVEKLKSITFLKGVLTDIIVEEATETDRKTIKQLMKRQRGKTDNIKKTITLLFNPIYQTHWIYLDYFASLGWSENQKEHQSDRLTILKTTYKDNAFLEQDDIDDLENETDKYFYNVYTLGNWGVLGNVIFTNWKIQDLSERVEHFDNLRDGLDFGFAKDPAAWPGSHYDKKHNTIYVYDEIYETDLDNEELAALLLPKVGYRRVVCDSAEPKSIKELKKYKINAVGAKKGPDSIRFGIKWLQKQTIVVDPKCVNMIRELQIAKWKEDAQGNPISPPRPVDKDNHLVDGLRYAYEDDANEKATTAIESPWD
jgi:phage terminase large subunit